jgi:hypothetical protein
VGLNIPPATNYQSPLIALPANTQDNPVEGRQQISVEVDWSTMGGPNKAVFINLQNNATLNWTQISSLKVDCSSCGANIQFLFPDTGEVIDIPANSPYELVPVFSNALQFYVLGANCTPEDILRFMIFNFVNTPAEVSPAPQANFNASANAVWGAAGATTQLIPTGINGTLRNLQISSSFQTAFGTNAHGEFEIVDGEGNQIIPSWKLGLSSNAANVAMSQPILSIADADVRFRNGLQIIFTPIDGWTTGVENMNAWLTYSTP